MSDEYVKDEEILETRWKCPSCEQENRGRDMKCAQCGAPKDESAAYRLDAAASAVTDAAQLADAEAGAHWTCAFCEKENRGNKTICRFCNADQTAKERKAAPPAPPPKAASRGWVAPLLVVLALVGLLVWWAKPRRVQATVDGIDWEQAVHLRVRKAADKEGWRAAVPSDAFDVDCVERQHGTRPVKSGSHEECREETKDLGNGYAKKQKLCKQVDDFVDEPVYDSYCRYRIYEWPVARTARRSGTTATGFEWPADIEAGAGASCLPCRDERGPTGALSCCQREAHYRVRFKDPAKPDLFPVYEAADAAELGRFAVGEAREILVSGKTARLAPPKK